MLVDMYAEIKGFSLRFQWFAGFSGEPLEPPLEYPPRLYRCDVVKKKNLACGEREKKNFVTDHKFFSCLHEGEVHWSWSWSGWNKIMILSLDASKVDPNINSPG